MPSRFVPLRAAVLTTLLVAGCGHSSFFLMRAEVQTPGAVRVATERIRGNIVQLGIYNLTGATMIVDRDRVTLNTPAGVRTRVPGGAETVYQVAPGGYHRLNVRFSVDDIAPGQTVYLQLQGAVLVDNQVIPIEPMPIGVQ